MSKYSGLPDIDQAPDVFETPDEPSNSQRHEDDPTDDSKKSFGASTDIDETAIPPRRDVGRMLDTFDSEPNQPESQLSRLRRLQAEVAQLEKSLGGEAHVQPSKSAAPSKVDLLSELSTLRGRLVTASDRIALPAYTGLEGLRLDDTSPAPGAESAVGLTEVDKRLANMERVLGTADSETPILGTIERLEHFLNILTQPRQLDNVARRVKLLLGDLDRATANARRTTAVPSDGVNGFSAADSDALHTLFTLLPRLDPLLPIIPPLVNRLRSLSSLHAEAIAVADDLRELQLARQAIAGEESEIQAVVAGVRRGMSEASSAVAENWDALRKRIEVLEERP